MYAPSHRPARGWESRLRAQLHALGCSSALASSTSELTTVKGLAYTSTGHERHTLDVYHAPVAPEAPGQSPKGLRPVVFYIHGGGWEGGDASMVDGGGYEGRAGDGNAWSKTAFFVTEGFVFFSTNYRLLRYGSWDGTMDASVDIRIGTMAEDCAKAMRWVHDHAAEYGGDGSSMVVMGHSAGAQLAALLCTDARLLRREGLDLGSLVKACIPIDGDTYDVPAVVAAGSRHDSKFGELAEQQELSAALHVKAAAWQRGQCPIPPFLALHIYGKSDGSPHPSDNNYCTAHQTRILADALGEAGVRCEVVGTANKDHVTLDSEIGKPGDFITSTVRSFLQSVLEQ